MHFLVGAELHRRVALENAQLGGRRDIAVVRSGASPHYRKYSASIEPTPIHDQELPISHRIAYRISPFNESQLHRDFR